MQIINVTRNTLLAEKAELANTFFSRLIGLLGRKGFEVGEALIIKPANQIHTFFMRFPIDVVFVDKQDKVVALKENLSPFRLTPFYFRASYCIELPKGAINSSHLKLGDQLKIA